MSVNLSDRPVSRGGFVIYCGAQFTRPPHLSLTGLPKEIEVAAPLPLSFPAYEPVEAPAEPDIISEPVEEPVPASAPENP